MNGGRGASIDPAGSEAKQLPSWFIRPVPTSDGQCALFARSLPEVLADLRVSADELQRWHDSGWLSFGPDRTAPVEDWDSNEIQFVRDVVRSGLPDALIAAHFELLPRPMNFEPDSIAYSFSLGWVMVHIGHEPDPFGVVDDCIVDWLNEQAEAGERGRLEEIRNEIQNLLATMTDAESEDTR